MTPLRNFYHINGTVIQDNKEVYVSWWFDHGEWKSIVSKAVRYATRKIRAIWTMELAEELRKFHDLNAEEELTKILNEELQKSIAKL
jgi:hypothetical protein